MRNRQYEARGTKLEALFLFSAFSQPPPVGRRLEPTLLCSWRTGKPRTARTHGLSRAAIRCWLFRMLFLTFAGAMSGGLQTTDFMGCGLSTLSR